MHTWLQLGVSKFSPSHFHPHTWFWSVSPPPSVLTDPSSSSSSSFSSSSRSCPFSTTAIAAKLCSTLPLTPCFLSLFFFFFFLLLHLHLRYITPLTCLTWAISANKSTKNRENHACNVELQLICTEILSWLTRLLKSSFIFRARAGLNLHFFSFCKFAKYHKPTLIFQTLLKLLNNNFLEISFQTGSVAYLHITASEWHETWVTTSPWAPEALCKGWLTRWRSFNWSISYRHIGGSDKHNTW